MASPTYDGSGKAIHVDDENISLEPEPGVPPEKEPVYEGQSVALLVSAKSPDHFDVDKLMGPQLSYPAYKGKSMAIHVKGPDLVIPSPATDPCLVADPFNRIEPTDGGVSPVGIAWVQYDGESPGPTSGLAYQVDGTGLIITAVDVSIVYGSIDFPLPANFTEFEMQVLISDYTASASLYINFQTPGVDSTAYLILHMYGAPYFQANDYPNLSADLPFDYDGRPFYVKARYSSLGIQASIWYADEVEPVGWLISADLGDRHGSLPPAISLEGDVMQANGDTLKVAQLVVRSLVAGPDNCIFENWTVPWTIGINTGAWTFGKGAAEWASTSPHSTAINHSVSSAIDFPYPGSGFADPVRFASLKAATSFSFLFRMTEPDAASNSFMSWKFNLGWLVSSFVGHGVTAIVTCYYDSGLGHFVSYIELQWDGFNAGPGGVSQGPNASMPTALFADGVLHRATLDFVGNDVTLTCEGLSVTNSDIPTAPQPVSKPADATNRFIFAFTADNDSGFNFGSIPQDEVMGLGPIEITGAALLSWCNPGGYLDACSVVADAYPPGSTPGPPPDLGVTSIAFRYQIGDPTTTLDHTICLLEAAAMALEWQTHGDVSVWGGELVPWCGRSEADIRAVGSSLANAAQAWLHWGQPLEIRAGHSWNDLLVRLSEGRAVILGGEYYALGGGRCDPGFSGGHGIVVLPYTNGTGWLIGDPLCSYFRYWDAGLLRAFAEAQGVAFYGAQSPQPIYFAVSRPWTA